MATKRVTHTFRKGDILEVKEYHDGRYGARGLPREKKRKPTPEQMAVVNAMNKAETARHRLLEYFGKGDYFLTLTYRVEERPPDMTKAKKEPKTKAQREYEEEMKRKKDFDDMARDNILYKKYNQGSCPRKSMSLFSLGYNSFFDRVFLLFGYCLFVFLHV